MEEFELVTYPRSRRATFDVGKIGFKKHHMVGLLEIDVTEAKKKLKESVQAGRRVSFTSWFIKVVGSTVAADRLSHVINYKSERQIAFNEVDISIPIEKEVNGVKVPIVTIIRNTSQKTIEEIHSEIQSSVKVPIDNEKDFVLTERKNRASTGLFFQLPQWARMIFWKRILKNPFSIKENMGTVMITNVGMFGKFAGWAIPKSLHNLSLGIGTMIKKPWVFEGKIEIRDILHLTVLFDHDAIDGGPATRFIQRLVQNLEQAVEL